MANRAIGEMAIFYGDKENKGMYDNGVWMHILDIPYLQNLEEASLYKVIIRTLWLESVGWSKRIREKYPHVKQIALSDHPLSTHISRLPADKQYAYLEDLQYVDGIMALTYEEQQFYQAAIPAIPVEHVGLPFPFESYNEKYSNLRELDKEYIGLGVGAADNDRNFISNLLVFQHLKFKYPDLKGVFLSVPHQLLPYCVYMADRFEDVYIHQRTEMEEYYEMLNRCKLVISLPDRNTPGRLQGEAAFFGVPVVGSDRLELQNELFPETAVSPFAIKDAIDQAIHLLENPEAASKLTNDAYARLEQYNYENSLEKFNRLLTRIKGEELVYNKG